jgi:DNA-binding MarR family transcriptional regulator
VAGGDETGDRLIARIRENWPAQASQSTELVIRLFRLHDLIWSRSKDEARRFGLTWGEFEALAALRSAGPPFQMTPTDINGLMIVTSGGLTKILHNLQAKGCVHRVGNEADQRSYFIALTEAGADLVVRLARTITEASDRLIASALSEPETRRLLRLLEGLGRAAEAPDQDRRG